MIDTLAVEGTHGRGWDLSRHRSRVAVWGRAKAQVAQLKLAVDEFQLRVALAASAVLVTHDRVFRHAKPLKIEDWTKSI